MLELYFKYPRVLRRLRDGELGDEMDRIAGYLSEAGYKRESAKIYSAGPHCLESGGAERPNLCL
jgi:hypothetical protein